MILFIRRMTRAQRVWRDDEAVNEVGSAEKVFAPEPITESGPCSRGPESLLAAWAGSAGSSPAVFLYWTASGLTINKIRKLQTGPRGVTKKKRSRQPALVTLLYNI